MTHWPQVLARTWLFALCLGMGVAQAQLPDALKQQLSLTSISGQFVVHTERDPSTGVAKQSVPSETYTYRVGVGPPITFFALRRGGSTNVIEVDPKLLAVTCEKVKKAVLNSLGLPDQWRGRVHVFVAPPSRRYQAVEIIPTRFGDGWQFRMGVPAECDWERLVRGIVEVVLLEIANREAGVTAVQAPLWLGEGLSGLIIADQGRALVTEPNAFLVVSGRKTDPLRRARELFHESQPASFTELGLPDARELGEPAAWERYQAAAQLFTQELLTDGDGSRQVAVFLRILPRHLNWQTAFLRAFNPRFLTLLDVERWWAVAVADFQSRDPLLRWSRDRILRQLDGIMRENAELRTGTNGPVTRQEVLVSQLVANWEFTAQRDVLLRKASQLRALHLHTPLELRPLVADFFQTIDNYLYQRANTAGDRDTRGEVATRGRLLVRETSRRLEQIEARITALQPTSR